MKMYICVALISWVLVLVLEDIVMSYNAKKCGYNCVDCKNWQCRKKTCAFKREKKI